MAGALTAAASWLKVIAEVAGEAFPGIKFLLKRGKKWLLQTTQPTQIGALACTVACHQPSAPPS